MICINRNNIEELLVTPDDITELLTKRSEEEQKVLKETLNSVSEFESLNNIELSTIRVKRDTALGKTLFEAAREDIISNPSEIIDSLIFNVLQNPAEDFLDNIEETLAREEKTPSDSMVEQILLSRKIGFTNAKESPLCIENKDKSLVKIGKTMEKK